MWRGWQTAIEQFAYYRRSAGWSAALQLAARNAVRPIYYRDEFRLRVSRRLENWADDPIPEGPGTIHALAVESVEAYDALEPRIHPYVRRQGLRDFLAGGSGGRYIVLTEYTPEDGGPAPIIGFRMYERGRFSIYEYGFGGPLPESFAMNLDTGVAPEYRGQRIQARGRRENIGHRVRLGIDTTVSVVRTHNAASLRSGSRPRVGRVRDEVGVFAITSWFGGRWRQTPNWERLRQRILEGPPEAVAVAGAPR
ncbi:MAG: hypothetical protein R3C39_00255 [Dehalococcoidia bacterium]